MRFERQTTRLLLTVATLSCAGMLTGLAAPAAHGQTQRPGNSFRDCASCPEMVVLPGGRFLIGSPATEPDRQEDEGPQRQITLARPFAVGRTEVTRAQYAAFARATNRPATANCWSDRNNDRKMEPDPASSWRDPGFAQDDRHPVVCVTWEDAKAYVAWLNRRTHGNSYRLLSEAEWEYAARAGSSGPFPWGQQASREHANYGSEECCGPATAGRDRWLHTAPVASFPANAFGLLDMHGNVGEWTADCYEPSLSPLPDNGAAYEREACEKRVIRNPGGSFGGRPSWLRSANRSGDPQSGWSNTNVGFRVAKSL